jgi:GTP-binding protein
MSTPVKILNFNLPTIALVGRVNVGKSTLFNRITESSHAIVSDIPGTTRTRNVSIATWRGKQFTLIDTGGLNFTDDVPLEKDIILQTEKAIKEADVIVFITDIQEGILPQEKELAKFLIRKKEHKTIIFAANKADSERMRTNIYEKEFLQLGFGAPIPFSAENGSGVGDLLDEVFKKLGKNSKRPKKIPELNPIKIAIVGKPNVGKSSLFNKLIGEERVIVSDMPHTTREPHDLLVEYEKNLLLFIDTAGIRKKSKVSGELEKEGIGKSLEAIKRADIVLFVIDTAEPVTDQDKQLAGFLREHCKSAIIIVNKWDLADDNSDNFRNEVKRRVRAYFPHIDFAPIIFTSALSGYKTHQILPVIIQAHEERKTKIEQEKLDDFIRRAIKKHLPSRGKGVRHPTILDFRQIHSNPPLFELFIKYKTSLNISYLNFLENRLRAEYGFFAAPIIIKLTKVKR